MPRKPRLVGGVKGAQSKRYFFPGKPRPVAGKLHYPILSRGRGHHILTDAPSEKADNAEPRTFSVQDIVPSTANALIL